MKFADIALGGEYAEQRGHFDVRDATHRVRVVSAEAFVSRRRYDYTRDTFVVDGAHMNTILVPLGHPEARGSDRHVAVRALDPETGEPIPGRGPYAVPTRQIQMPWAEYARLKAARDAEQAELDRREREEVEHVRRQLRRIGELAGPDLTNRITHNRWRDGRVEVTFEDMIALLEKIKEN